MDQLGFYLIGFITGGYLKSAIFGCPVNATIWIEPYDKRTQSKIRIDLPWVPELLGAAIVGSLLHAHCS